MEKKPKDTAVALKYDMEEDIAPKVIAKGQGEVAKKIVERAEEHDIPIYQDPKLAKQLDAISMDDMIPEELYDAVAQILVFIAKVDSDGF